MITIICPACTLTGGPELLHQLGYKLRLFGFDAYMCYYNVQPGVSPVCVQYEKYNVPYVNQIEDSLGNIVVFPETLISSIPKVVVSTPVLWWMSVDNARVGNEEKKIIDEYKNIIHFSQSQYSSDYLINDLKVSKERIIYVSDYINSLFLNQSLDLKRSNIVAFNPTKGWEKTSELIKKSNGTILWRAIKGMTPEGVQSVLNSSKVYIDFGNHPGKDRIPREAVLSGCCILTGKRGSAANDVDICIPQSYKFNDDSDAEDILDAIYDLVDNYDSKRETYLDYIDKIKHEFIDFEVDVYRAFSRLQNVDDSKLTVDELMTNILQLVYEGEYEAALKNIVIYRINGFEEIQDFLILEGYVRIGLKEYFEAEYVLKRCVEYYGDNAESYMLIAKAISLGYLNGEKIKECLKFCQMATDYAEGTEDYDQIFNEINAILQQFEKNNVITLS